MFNSESYYESSLCQLLFESLTFYMSALLCRVVRKVRFVGQRSSAVTCFVQDEDNKKNVCFLLQKRFYEYINISGPFSSKS
jgi:hypothetical protein